MSEILYSVLNRRQTIFPIILMITCILFASRQYQSITAGDQLINKDFKRIYFTSIEKQVLTIYTNLSRFCFLGTTPVLAPKMWSNENPKVETRSRESNSGPYGCEADAVLHDHGHHKIKGYRT